MTTSCKRKRRPQDTCRCPAYPFPHRLNGGDCTRETRAPVLIGLEGWYADVRRSMQPPWMR